MLASEARRRSLAARRWLLLEPGGRWHCRLTTYIVREHRRGRPVAEILDDRFVREHASASAISHLLVDPHLIHRLADDCRRPLPPGTEQTR
jgi:hypothetical protein